MKERIKSIRQSAKLNQSEFGAVIGVKQSAITAYETGVRTPSNAVLKAICDKFSVSRQWLETGEGEMCIETNTAMIDRLVAEYNGSEVFRAILETYMSLPDDSRRAVEEFVARLMDYKQNGAPTDIMTLDDLPRPEEPAQSDLVQDV